MPITPENIQEARLRGASDEQILESISRNDPELGESIRRGREAGINDAMILGRISDYNDPEFLESDQAEEPQRQPSIGETFMQMAQQSEEGFREEIVKPILSGLGKAGIAIFGGEIGPAEEESLTELATGESVPQQRMLQLQEMLQADPQALGQFLEGGVERLFKLGAVPGIAPGATAAAAGAGQLAEEAGFGEAGQFFAELAGLGAKGIINRAGEAIGKDVAVAEAGRRLGLSEAEIAPLINGEFKEKWVGKIASTLRSKNRLATSKEAQSRVYQNFEQSAAAKDLVPEAVSDKGILEITDRLRKMPEPIRKAIAADFGMLTSEPITPNSLSVFWRKLNGILSRDKKQLSLLKEPVMNMLRETSPELAAEWADINKVAAKYASISEVLSPSLIERMFEGGEALVALGSIVTGNIAGVAKIAASQGIRELATETLLNPKFQGLSSKIASGIREGRWNVVSSLVSKYADAIDEDFPEFANELRDISIADLRGLSEGKL